MPAAIRKLVSSATTILWDWNGTLLNDPPLACRLFNETITQYGAPHVTLERYREIYEHPLTLLYERAGIDYTQVSFETIANQWHEVYARQVHTASLHNYATELLGHFKTNQTPQHILSALPQHLLTEALESRELVSYFGKVSGLEGAHLSTKFESGRQLVSDLKLVPEQTLLIGDSSHDAEVARELGLSCLLVADGAESKVRLLKNNYLVLENLGELWEALS